MTNLGAEARYRLDHVEVPLRLSGPGDVDALIDSLLEGPDDQNLAQLHSLDRTLLPSGDFDHELLVGADRALGVGALAFMDEGNWTTLGPEGGRTEVNYFIMGHLTEFPERSDISIDLLRRAVKEFVLSGGKRPTCVDWQVPEYW
ncbi:Imm1 family immunity protein [Krasilnikovia sp. MM14-A1259]|uniref:Imm1 family immunity protein n=1 Tax=Krasilnikovia sp. MM14-A1259 TaxID=3373539 RepID=UPI00381E6015